MTVSNGGLNAPLPDMALYLAFLLGDPARQAEYDTVLRRSSLEEMWRPVIEATDEVGAPIGMGLTFFLESRFGLELVAHSGTQNGFLSHFFAHPPSRTAYLVAYNTQAGGDEAKEAAPDGSSTRRLDLELRDYLLLSRARCQSRRGRSRPRRGSRRRGRPPWSSSCGGRGALG